MVRAFLTLLFSILLSQANAQSVVPSRIEVEKYTTKDGLSSNIVHRAIKDSRGFLWLATADGLNRFDGKDFKVFRHQPGDTLSISGNLVYRIAEDKAGDLWVITSNGLCKYLREKNHFISYHFPWIDHVEKQYSIEPDLLMDNNKLWFTDFEGVNVLDVVTNKIIRYKLQKPFHGRHLISLGKDNYNRIFAGSTEGTFLLNEANGEFEKTSLPFPDAAPFSFYSGSDKSLWISVWGEGVVNVKDTLSKAIKYGGKESLFQVYEVATDSFIACGDFPGLITFSRKNPTFRPATIFNKSSGLQESFVISSIASFDEDFVWLTGSDGLLKWDRRPGKFQSITFDTSGLDLPLKINALISDPVDSSEIWVNVWYQNLIRYNLNTGKTTYYFDEKKQPLSSLPWGYYNSMYADDDGTVLVTGQFGIWRYDHYKNDFVQLKQPQNSESMIQQPCFRIVKLRNGNLISIARGKGVIEFNKELGFYKEYPFNFDNMEVRDLNFSSMVEVDDNTVMLCSVKTGLYALDRRNGKFKRLTRDRKGVSFPGNLSMVEKDKEGNIWIGTLEQIIVLDSTNSISKYYTTHNGLPSNRIQYIFKDSRDIMWVSTRNGLSYFDDEVDAFKSLTENDGLLQNDSYYLNELYSGDVAVTHHKGISIMKHSLMVETNDAPALHFTEMLIGKQEYPAGFTSELTVKAGEGPVQIRFAVIDFANSDNITYSYKLEGATDWIQLGNSNVLSFYELTPGKYRLLVNAINADGIQTKSPISLSIQVLSPFYLTWWFRTLIALFAASVIYGFYHVRVQKRRELELIRARLSRDLHDDIGSTLSSISMLSRSARKRLVENDAISLNESLEKISDRSARLLDNMNDIIWSVKPEHDSLESILSRMRDYASTILESKKITFDITFPESAHDETLSLDLKNNIYMIFKEALNNCVKYSDCTHVVILFEYKHGKVEMTIADNGNGFDLENSASGGPFGGNGLQNMRKRAQEAGAILKIKSVPGKGTTIRFSK